MTTSRGGRRRSPIWQHFDMGSNADGNRSAACRYCARVMKPQPDRMVNHFLKLCPQVDATTRRQWLTERAASEAAETALATASDLFAVSPSRDDAGAAMALPTAAPTILVEQTTSASDDDPHTLVDTSVVGTPMGSARPRRPLVRGAASAKKRQEERLELAQLQQTTPDDDDDSSATDRQAIACELNDDSSALTDMSVAELQRRQLVLETRRTQLQVESLRYDNTLKRLKVAEEHVLARKRLRDAGVPQTEIDLLLPLQPMPTAID